MLGLSGEEIQSMGKQVKHGAKGALGTFRVSGKIQDKAVVGDHADATAEGGERRVTRAVLANEFGNPWN
jgi:creatinine amidohydrolase/Fe(II)-dependent formamide hydrolase-like protein